MANEEKKNKRFVALLRGINVGGNTMIKMEELRTMFEALGFANVVTYINSGNIAFDLKSSGSGQKSAKPWMPWLIWPAPLKTNLKSILANRYRS